MQLTPKPYQQDGISFLARNAAALLGDDAGLGKSMQMIRAANGLGLPRIIVFAPAVGKVSWALQFEDWDMAQRPVYMHPADTKGKIPSGPCALIVTVDWLSNKDRATKFKAMLRKAEPFDVAFVDEAHYLKTPSSNRTRALYGYHLNLVNSCLEGVERKWLASATFTPLNASELYPHLKALFPDLLAGLFGGNLPTAWEFTQRFCTTQLTDYGIRITGNNPQTIPALRAALKPIFLMRLKADVLSELPPILTDTLGLDAKLPAPADKLDEARVAAMSDDEFLAYVAAQAGAAHSTKRMELGIAKADAAWPWMVDFLTFNPAKKLIVFAHHTDVIEGLKTRADGAGFGAVSFYGKTPDKDKAGIVRAFQNDADVRLFIGHVRAAGTSITLTAADTVLLLEPDPSPLNNYQAISRAHRLGQKDLVRAIFAFAAKDPTDKRLATVLKRRAQDFEQLFGASIPNAA